jgi:hypothetical protein
MRNLRSKLRPVMHADAELAQLKQALRYSFIESQIYVSHGVFLEEE